MYVKQRDLVMSGWRVGSAKVRLTKTLQSEFSYTLALAKSVTDLHRTLALGLEPASTEAQTMAHATVLRMPWRPLVVLLRQSEARGE